MKITKTNSLAKMPTLGSDYAAGLDLYAAIQSPLKIEPHTTRKIDIGIAVEIPEGNFGMIVPRSGISVNEGLRLANCAGIIDSDYRGNVIVALYNDSDEVRMIEPKQRIAQLIIVPYTKVEIEEVLELSDTKRGNGGFGHSGKF